MKVHNYYKKIISIILLGTFSATAFSQSSVSNNSVAISKRAELEAESDYQVPNFRKIVIEMNDIPSYRIQSLIDENKSEEQILGYRIAYLEKFHQIQKQEGKISPLGGLLLSVAGCVLVFNSVLYLILYIGK